MKDIRLWGILILALGLRTIMLFSVFADVRRAVTPDSTAHIGLAVVIRERHSFGSSYEISLTPGYPALIAGSAFVADMPTADFLRLMYNIHALDGNNYPSPPPLFLKLILDFQVLLDLHLVLLTFFLCRALAGHGAGLLAALFQALSPLAAAASCRILTDSIFAFLLIAAVVLLIRHFRTAGWWSLTLAALIMGAACYVRPVGLVFSAVMAFVVLCSRRSTGVSPVSPTGVPPAVSSSPGRAETALRLMGGTPMLRQKPMRPRRLLRLAAFAGIILACIAPWVARNVMLADYWGFSSFATDSLYWYSAAEIKARVQNTSVKEIRDHFATYERHGFWIDESTGEWLYPRTTTPAGDALSRDDTPGELDRRRFAKARRIIAEHPWDFVDIHLRDDMVFWLPGAPDAMEVLGCTTGGECTLDVLHRQGLIAAAKHYFGDNTPAMILAGATVLVMLIRYGGVVLCGPWPLWPFRHKMTAAGWLCLLLVLTAWLLPEPAYQPPCRVPVEPILSVGAAIGWLGLIDWFRRRRRGPAAEESSATDLTERV